MSREPAPCKECTERELACHGKCERYQAWRRRLDALNKKIRLDKQATKYPVIIYPEDQE